MPKLKLYHIPVAKTYMGHVAATGFTLEDAINNTFGLPSMSGKIVDRTYSKVPEELEVRLGDLHLYSSLDKDDKKLLAQLKRKAKKQNDSKRTKRTA